MINVADIASQALPQPAAASPVSSGEGDDFFDRLLREVDRQDIAERDASADETARSEPAKDDAAPAAAADVAPAAPPPAAVPWTLAAAAAEVTKPAVPAAAFPTETAAAAPMALAPTEAAPTAAAPMTAAPQTDDGVVPPAAVPAAIPPTPANPVPLAVNMPAAAPAAPVATPGAAPAATASNPPGTPDAAANPPAPVPVATAEARTTPDATRSLPATDKDTAEAASILQVIGPRRPQASAATPLPVAAAPVAVAEVAPLRTLREAMPVPPAGATTPEGVATVAGAVGAASHAGTGKGNSGDLGFKTDLGSVFAALNATTETATPDDFRTLVASQARAAASDLPAAAEAKMPPAANGSGAPAPGAATAVQTTNHAETSQTTAARQPAPPVPPGPATLQISVQMIRAVGEGVSKINVDLNPAELGRVEVKIEVGSDGRVQGTVTADRQDTFDMLQRDSRALERALLDAGLRADPQSLSFNLRGESQQGRTAPENPVSRADTRESAAAADLPPPPPPSRPGNMPAGAIDIRV